MKLFIVEDEVFALRTLSRKIIDLQKDYEIVGTATDGTEALPKIKASKPAVVLTDIRMNGMDGLTLIQKMQEEKISALPVIISGYQEFEYAKQAMHLGVEDYLLKPVELAELEKCLETCREKLKKKYADQNIYSFLIGDEKFSLESITSNDNLLLCYLIFCTPLNNTENFLHPVAGHIARQDVQDFFSNHMPNDSIFCFDGTFSNEKILILDIGKSEKKAQQALKKLIPELAEAFHFPVTGYYMMTPADALTYNIKIARRNCVRNSVLGLSRCLNTLPKLEPAENLTELIHLLALLIQQDDRELIHSNLLRLCMKWQTENRTLVAVQADLIFILKALNQIFCEQACHRLDTVFYVENICCFSSSFEELATNFTQLLIQLFTIQKNPEEQNISGEQLVEKIEKYFHENISRSITLQLLSDEMNISKVYLCRIFKKYKNVTPIDYFNRLKIERSQELLDQFSSLPLQKISDMLGFNDVYYFSKVFKKIVGISPSAYRKNNNK